MEPLVSIIVPVYRVEPYLRQCVDSILEQTYNKIEVILVDDGSPDRCGIICDEYAQKDSRVQVIHKTNGGLSDARNAGMEIAAGDNLMFVDSDDLITKDAVETLVNVAFDTEADMVIGDHRRFYEEPIKPDFTTNRKVQCMDTTSAMADMLRNGCASWARLYKMELHRGLLFPVGEINEDEAIVLRLLSKCSRIAKTDDVVYHYRCRPESITTASFSTKKMDWYYHCISNLDWICKNQQDLVPLALDRLGSCVVFLLHQIALADYKDEKIVSLLREDLRKNYHMYQKYYLSGKREKVRMWFLNYFPYGFYRVLISWKKRFSKNGEM